MERKHTIRIVLATSVFLASCAPKTPQSIFATPEGTPASTPIPNETPGVTPMVTPMVTPSPTESTPTSVKNRVTGAIFNVTQNPEGRSGKCVILTSYTDSNKQDVVGAATALGPDPGKYNDYPRFTVYMPDQHKLGSFTTDTVAPADPFGVVPPGTIVCED